jgi:RNA polymerase sigma factor (sigma-70 family)
MATRRIGPIIQQLRRNLEHRDATPRTDGKLLEAFHLHRDAGAFEALVYRHGPMVLGVCQRMLRDTHDAEDAFQATFLVLARKAATVWPREMVGNWLYGVAHTTALRARVANAKRRLRERQVANMPERSSTASDLRDELHRSLDEELVRLPAKYRVPIVLCDLECRTRREVAAQLRIPEGTLSSRLTTARRMLARRLARRGIAVSGGALAMVVAHQTASAGLSASLVDTTVKAAALGGGTPLLAMGIVAPQVATLTEGVLKTMLISKLKAVIGVLLVLGVATVGGALLRQESAIAQQHVQRPESRPQPTQGDPQPRISAATDRAGDYNALFDRALEVLGEQFTVEHANRFDGRIETLPLLAKHAGGDGAGPVPVRWRAMVQIAPTDSGTFAVQVRVEKEQQRKDNARSATDATWQPIGRDTDLEQRILKRLQGGAEPTAETNGGRKPRGATTERRFRQFQVDLTLVQADPKGKDLGKEGKGKLLAAPTLLVVEGEEAYFFSGGEVAIPGDPTGTDSLAFGVSVRIKVKEVGDRRMRLETVLERTALNPNAHKGTETHGSIIRSVAIVKLGETITLREMDDGTGQQHWVRVRIANATTTVSQTESADDTGTDPPR